MKRIVWDWNGTLFNDVDLCFDCINRLLVNHRLSPLKDLDAYRNVFQFPIETYYKKVGFDFEQTSFDILAHEYMEDYQEKSYSCNLQGDAMVTLEDIKSKEVPQVILSASKIEYLNKQIQEFELTPYIDSVFGIQDIYAKSKLDIAKKVKSQYNEELWFIGDSVHDYQVAQGVDSNCVLVTTGHQSREILESTNAPVFSSLKEAWDYIWKK